MNPKSILIVEPDPVILLNAVELCEDLGFTVVATRDGISAIRLLSRPNDFCALFSALEGPNAIDGFRLAKAARARRPEIAIVLIGYDLE